jgi:hypothetical protein
VTAHFAIPATTFVLKAVIEKALAKVYGAGGNAPPVSIAPPPRSDPLRPPPNGDPEATSVLLFLYHVTPNAAWRNIFDPPVDGAGTRVARAPLVLDLHYLIAATGVDFEREAVFGVALHALTRLGILPRLAIKAILEGVMAPPANAPLMAKLTTEKLWEQYEQITLSQQALDADSLSRLWTAFQSPFRPSAGITATTVFLDIEENFPVGPVVKEVGLAARPRLDREPVIAATEDRVTVK